MAADRSLDECIGDLSPSEAESRTASDVGHQPLHPLSMECEDPRRSERPAAMFLPEESQLWRSYDRSAVWMLRNTTRFSILRTLWRLGFRLSLPE
jgi:hypothetical protein